MDLVYDENGEIKNLKKKEFLLKADYELFKYFRLNDLSGIENLNQKYVQNQSNKKKCSCACKNAQLVEYKYLSSYQKSCDHPNFLKLNFTCYLTSC
jgi:hypothetical protein